MTAYRIPLVALVGRPNVGKSTIFNRLVGRRTALVEDFPGVTRDRIFGEATVEGRCIRVVDTGGFEEASDDPFFDHMVTQTRLAIDEADLIVFVVDARAGLLPADHDVAELLRRSGRKFILGINKVDGPDQRQGAFAEMAGLGIEIMLPLSAEHAHGFGALSEEICRQVDAPTEEAVAESLAYTKPLTVDDEDLPEGEATRVEWQGGPVHVAVVGKPNVGKSSLVNRIIGEERLLATDIAGTTRDSVDTSHTHEGQEFVFIDTAGMRRKSAVKDKLEKFSVMAALRSIERADVVMMVFDGAEGVCAQDAKIAAIAHERGKGVVLIANKWDLVDDVEWAEEFYDKTRYALPFVSYAPLVRVSAKTGRSVHKLFDTLVRVQRERHRRVGTAELNRFFEHIVGRSPPTTFRGKRPKFYYASQPLVRPPTFIFTVARPDNIPKTYMRYLRNSLRDRYGFEGTPLWLKFRPRGKTARGTHKGSRSSKLDK